MELRGRRSEGMGRCRDREGGVASGFSYLVGGGPSGVRDVAVAGGDFSLGCSSMPIVFLVGAHFKIIVSYLLF